MPAPEVRTVPWVDPIGYAVQHCHPGVALPSQLAYDLRAAAQRQAAFVRTPHAAPAADSQISLTWRRR